MGPARSVWIGYDQREAAAFAVAMYSIRRFDPYIPIKGMVLADLQARGLYTRPTIERMNIDHQRQLIDVLSARDDYAGAISTEHANARFLVPHLAKFGWALFIDCDVMVLENIDRLFSLADQSKALMCVQHDHRPAESTKMDGQAQTQYPRKNQSSVMLFNCDHPANRRLTLDLINTRPGRDLHAFCWLDDSEIGALPAEWNYLVGYSKSAGRPKLVHFTRGLPDMPGYERQEFADEWRAMVPRAIGAL